MDEDINNAEPDSDTENQDSELDAWLGQLNDLTEDLGGSASPISPPMRKPVAITPTQTIDSFRFSVIQGVEENQDIDLDALLGELCAIENQLTTTSGQLNDAITTHKTPPPKPVASNENAEQSNEIDFSFLDEDLANFSSEIDIAKMAFGISVEPVKETKKVVKPPRKSIPPQDVRPKDLQLPHDNNIETVESVGGPHQVTQIMSIQQGQRVEVRESQRVEFREGQSSEVVQDTTSIRPASSGESNTTVQLHEVQARLQSYQKELENSHLPPNEQEILLKQEKMKIAMEKIKEANIKKLFVRVFAEDGSTKSIMADETMTCREILDSLVEKSHYIQDLSWSLVEQSSELYLERIYEDHENLVEAMLLWTPDSANKVLIVKRVEKYDMCVRPEEYLLGPDPPPSSLGEEARRQLLEEFFNSGAVPELEHELYLKADGKKAWKKYPCVLRKSGIYYNPKGKGKSSKDLVSLAQTEFLEVYEASGWKKKYKAPTDYGFALKHPQIQKKTKYIKYVCTEDERTLRQWMTGIRIAKHGQQLLDNFKQAQGELRKHQPHIMPSINTQKMQLNQGQVPVLKETQRTETNFKDLDQNTTARIPLTTDITRHLVKSGCTSSISGDSGIGKEETNGHVFDEDLPLPEFPAPPSSAELQMTPTPDLPPKSGHMPSLVAELRHRASSETGSPRSSSKTSSTASNSSGGDYDSSKTFEMPSVTAQYVSVRTSATERQSPPKMLSVNQAGNVPPPVARKPDRISPSRPTSGAAPHVARKPSPEPPSVAKKPPSVAKKPSPEPPPVAKKPGPPAVAAKPKPSVPVRSETYESAKTNPTQSMTQEQELPKVAPKPGQSKPGPPPPPKRGSATGQQPANSGFLSDLENVFAKRGSTKVHGVNPEKTSSCDGDGDLPPPPPELLQGLPAKSGKKKPPPPPKRSDARH